MFAYIAQSRTPRAKPAITFVCANSQNPGNCSSDSVLTYPDPSLDPAQKPSLPQPVTGVGFCPSFFDPDQPSAKNIYMLAPPAVCQDLTFSKLIQSGTVMVDAYASADGFGGNDVFSFLSIMETDMFVSIGQSAASYSSRPVCFIIEPSKGRVD
jgi:hypothetical protein